MPTSSPRMTRTLHLAGPPFMHGADVKALQLALVAAGLLPRKAADGEYGATTAHACELAKGRLGYPKALIHPGHECAGDELLALLTGRKKPPLAWRALAKARREQAAAVHPSIVAGVVPAIAAKHAPAAQLAAQPTKDENRAALQRAGIVAAALWGVAHEPQIHYTMTAERAAWLRAPRRALPLSTDCSGFATFCCHDAGVEDPSGFGYREVGYTGTLLHHLKAVPQSLARAGDLAVFGAYPGHHVVILLQDGPANGGDPNCVSHGQEKGPMKIRLQTEAQYQPSPITFLRTVTL